MSEVDATSTCARCGQTIVRRPIPIDQYWTRRLWSHQRSGLAGCEAGRKFATPDGRIDLRERCGQRRNNLD